MGWRGRPRLLYVILSHCDGGLQFGPARKGALALGGSVCNRRDGRYTKSVDSRQTRNPSEVLTGSPGELESTTQYG